MIGGGVCYLSDDKEYENEWLFDIRLGFLGFGGVMLIVIVNVDD